MARRMQGRVSPVTLATGALAAAVVVTAVIVITPGSEDPPAASERTVAVTQGVIQSTVSGSGNLSPRRTFDLSFGASGKVAAVYVNEGDKVSKGDLLAVLDTSEARVALAQAQADLVDAQDTLDDVIEYEASSATTTSSSGATTASEEGEAPQQETAEQEATPQEPAVSREAAEAQVASAQLSVQSAEEALAETKLRAPVAGTIASVSGAKGDTVSAGSSGSSSGTGSDSSSSSGSDSLQPLSSLGSSSSSSSSSSDSSSSFVQLVDVKRLSMEVSLSESDIGKVKVGQPATVTVNALTDGGQVSATVTAVSVLPSSSDSTGSAVSYPVTLTLDQSARGIRTGMSATADIIVSEVKGMSVPNQALRGTSVTVERNGKRTDLSVETGAVGDTSTQIVSGLEDGDKVVVTSQSAAAGAAAGSGSSTGAGNGERGGGFGGGGPPGGGGFPGGGSFPGGGPPGGARP